VVRKNGAENRRPENGVDLWRQFLERALLLLLRLPVTGKLLAYLASLLITAKSCGSTSRSADTGDNVMFIPRTRLRQDERAFSVTAPRQWNRLPTEICCILNTEQFKHHLKTFLFKSTFHSLIADILKPF